MEAGICWRRCWKIIPGFWFVALLVSGGHTQLISVTELVSTNCWASRLTMPPAKRLDKTAKLLLGLIILVAHAVENGVAGDGADVFVFPRPMTDRPGLDFSFSGLKTCR